MLDLPDRSVIVGGLEHWHGERLRIHEERLEARLCQILDLDEVPLYAPPVETGEASGPRAGIVGFEFPRWYLAQVEETFTDDSGREYRTRPMVRHDRLVRGKYLNENRKGVHVVPVRFVRACVKGHIGDIDWYSFVRRDPKTDRTGQLWLDEGGAGNDFSEIYVRCERTKMRRPLSEAKLPDGKVLGYCDGRMPWLGPHAREGCDKVSRLLTRSASYAYFSQSIPVIAIPDRSSGLKDAVNDVYEDFLQYAQDLEEVSRERRKHRVAQALDGFTDEEVWGEVDRRKRRLPPPVRGIKQAEIEMLLSAEKCDDDDLPDREFVARARSLDGLPPLLSERVSKIVLVHRLREVKALVGFTRFEHVMPDVDGDLSVEAERAPLARDLTWLPAVENRGEGVLVAFSSEAIDAWRERPAVKARVQRLINGFEAWRRQKRLGDVKQPDPAYIMLQSLSHLLITAVSLECGYSASAITERVYAGPSGHAILLYTGSSGSEGTLGGIIEVGRRIEHHLMSALQSGTLCSNDPVCAAHDPADPHEERFLHGAACHGCLLIAETSCERRNELLDRALVVPTLSTPDAAFFPLGGGPAL